MGLIDTMALSSALWSGVLPGSPMILWVVMVGMLATAAAGIWLAVPRRERLVVRALRLAGLAEAH